MRKYIIILATVLGLCTLSLTGCQRGEKSPAPTNGATAEQTTPTNQGPEPLSNANQAEQQQQPVSNTPDIAATSPNSSQDNTMQNQGDNSQTMAAGTVSGGTNNTATPTDQSGTMQNTMPNTPNTAGQNPTQGNEAVPGSTPSTDGNMNKSDNNADTTSK